MRTIDSLKSYGLDEREAKVYLASLELGESTVLPIAKKSGLGRTYCYDILESLGKKGLVSFVEKNGRRRYSAASPKTLKEDYEDKMKELDKIMPELEGLFKTTANRPKVRFFEGREGAEIIYREILKEAKEAWFIGSIADWARNFPNYVDYVKSLVKLGIKVRDLVTKNSAALKYQSLFKKPKQETRFLPSEIKFSTDNMIFNDKLVMISYGRDLHVVSIESPEIANTFRAIYEFLWNSSTSYF